MIKWILRESVLYRKQKWLIRSVSNVNQPKLEIAGINARISHRKRKSMKLRIMIQSSKTGWHFTISKSNRISSNSNQPYHLVRLIRIHTMNKMLSINFKKVKVEKMMMERMMERMRKRVQNLLEILTENPRIRLRRRSRRRQRIRQNKPENQSLGGSDRMMKSLRLIR